MRMEKEAQRASAADLYEPLALSAPLAWARAAELCPPAADSRGECVWYHRVWQYLRLLGVITTVATNADFLIAFFRERARAGGFRRVLISAAADYALLAHIAHAYRLENAPLEVTLVDRCGTAIFLNRWYAEHAAVDLDARVGDVLTYVAKEPFDVVCSHNFLSRFRAEERPRLIERWHAHLRAGGVAVTTQRIRPNATYERDSFSPDDASAFAAKVERAARAYPRPLGVDPGELAAVAREYALRKGGWVIRSNEEITRAFEAAGFRIERADHGGGAPERARDRPSSKAGSDTYRMRLVAERVS